MPAGGEAGHVHAGFGNDILGGAAAPAGLGSGLLELFLIRSEQFLDHLGQLINLSG